MFLVVFLFAILASTFIFAKKTLMYANPFFIIGFRMILASIFLLGFHLFRNKWRLAIKREDWFLFFKMALFHVYFAFIPEFWALQYLSALKTTLIYSATPFIAAILSYFLLKERLSLIKIGGIVIGLGGLMPVLLSKVTGVEARMELCSISIPEGVLFISVVCGAYAWFLVKELMDKGYGLGLINGMAMLIGGVLSMGTAFTFEGFTNPVRAWLPFLGWLLLLIISANFIVYTLYAWLLKRYSLTFITFAGFLSPSFGTLYEWLFLGGTISWHYPLSIGLVALGLYVFCLEDFRL